jgi:hypothetical protein
MCVAYETPTNKKDDAAVEAAKAKLRKYVR